MPNTYPYSNIEEYIEQSPPQTQEMLNLLRQTIAQAASGSVEKIAWGMPTFTLDGKNLAHFALAKKHIGFFPGGEAVATFKPRLEPYQFTEENVGTIRFPLDKPLPVALVHEIVTYCIDVNAREAAEKAAKKNASLESLPNMGKVLAKNLRAVGIDTPTQLREVGAKDAFLRIRAAVDPGACIQMLYGLQGAVDGIRDTLLDAEVKQQLRDFLKGLG